MLAQIIEGKIDFADFAFCVAFLAALVYTAIALFTGPRDYRSWLLGVVLTGVSLGLFVL